MVFVWYTINVTIFLINLVNFKLVTIINGVLSIKTLFHNKLNNSIIFICLKDEEDCPKLYCNEILLSSIHDQDVQPNELFKGELISFPSGYIEFDDTNGVVLTCSNEEKNERKVYKIWDLKDYSLLLVFNDYNILEIKLSIGCILVVSRTEDNLLKFTIFCIESKKVI
jgi:hypothetical protein